VVFPVQFPGLTRQQKVGKLLDIIPTRGEKAFPALIRALVDTEQDHLANLLDPALTREYINRADCDQSEITEVDSAAGAAVIAEKSVGEKVNEIRTF